jgi:magnesium transporter
VAAVWSVGSAATVSLTLRAICAWAATIGALLSLLSSRLRIDPAVVGAPLVTTLVDATGAADLLRDVQLLVR